MPAPSGACLARRVSGAHPAVWLLLRLAGLGLVLLTAGLLTGLIVVGTHGGGPIQDWDIAVWRWSTGHRGRLVGPAKAADVGWLGPLCVVASSAWFALRRSPRLLAPVLASLAGAGLVGPLRAVIHRPRPPTADYPAPGAVPGVHETSYSFPSGHAVTATAVIFALLGLVAVLQHRWWPWLAAFSLSAAVAYSRLLLGVHWFSDATAGMVLGGVWGIAVAVVCAHLTWSDLALGRRSTPVVTAAGGASRLARGASAPSRPPRRSAR